MSDTITNAPKGFTPLYRLYLKTLAKVTSGAVLSLEEAILADDELKAVVLGAEHAKSGSRWSPEGFADAVENWCGGG